MSPVALQGIQSRVCLYDVSPTPHRARTRTSATTTVEYHDQRPFTHICFVTHPPKNNANRQKPPVKGEATRQPPTGPVVNWISAARSSGFEMSRTSARATAGGFMPAPSRAQPKGAQARPKIAPGHRHPRAGRGSCAWHVARSTDLSPRKRLAPTQVLSTAHTVS